MIFPESLPSWTPPTKTVRKGWGYEVWFHNADGYCMKALCFMPGGKCSMHFHGEKCETWLVIAGAFNVTVIDTERGAERSFQMTPGCWLDMRRFNPHRLEAVSLDESVIIEASTTHIDADSYRIAPGDSQK